MNQTGKLREAGSTRRSVYQKSIKMRTIDGNGGADMLEMHVGESIVASFPQTWATHSLRKACVERLRRSPEHECMQAHWPLTLAPTAVHASATADWPALFRTRRSRPLAGRTRGLCAHKQHKQHTGHQRESPDRRRRLAGQRTTCRVNVAEQGLGIWLAEKSLVLSPSKACRGRRWRSRTIRNPPAGIRCDMLISLLVTPVR